MRKKITKIILLGVVLIMGLSIFAGCGTQQEISFEKGNASIHASLEQEISIVIRSLEEWSKSDAANHITLDEKYDNSFFEGKALVIVAFRTASNVEIGKVEISRRQGHLTVNVVGEQGTMAIVDSVILALEVSSGDIEGIRNVRITTNLTKI